MRVGEISEFVVNNMVRGSAAKALPSALSPSSSITIIHNLPPISVPSSPHFSLSFRLPQCCVHLISEI
jgi:hypothetical protein